MGVHAAITAALTFVAVARLTRLATTDSITAPLRKWLNDKARPTPPGPSALTLTPVPAPAWWRFFDGLIGCPWCISIWIAFPAATVWHYCHSSTWFTITTLALTYSHLTGLAHSWLDSPPPVKVISLTPTDLHVTNNNR